MIERCLVSTQYIFFSYEFHFGISYIFDVVPSESARDASAPSRGLLFRVLRNCLVPHSHRLPVVTASSAPPPSVATPCILMDPKEVQLQKFFALAPAREGLPLRVTHRMAAIVWKLECMLSVRPQFLILATFFPACSFACVASFVHLPCALAMRRACAA